MRGGSSMLKGTVHKFSFITALIVALLSAAAVAIADDTGIPEYIGSQACLGCHAEKFSRWKSSSHAKMVVPIINASELPLDISRAPEKLQAELRKASFMVA